GGPAPPPNLCTGPGSLVAGSKALPGASSGAALVHWAVEAPVLGYVALGWAAKAGVMVPMDTVIGGVGGNGQAYLATYRLDTYAISPANADNWALAGGAARTPLGKTVICFSTAATGPAASGRRLQQLLEAGLTAAPTTTLQMNYAVHTSNSLLYHVESGSFALNPATGSLQATRSSHLRRYIVAHASLMLLAFVFLMPTGVLLARHRSLYINKTLGGKGLWFYAHVACQLLAVACFIAGVTIALVVFDSGVPSNVQRIGESHEVIGIILIAMVAVQVLLAVAARPAPGTPRRPMWDLLHHNWGRATLLLAWANCFLGIVYFARGWGLLALTENQLLTALLVPAAVCLLLLGILDVVLSLVSRNRPVASTAVLAAEASKGSTGKERAGGGPFVADGVFYAELNELLTRELAEDGYSGVEVRVTPMRTEIIIKATRTQNVLGEKGRRIRELTSVVQKRFNFPPDTVELYAEKVADRGLCAVAQAESLRYKLLGGLAVRRACYGVLRFVMESGAKGCEVIVSGKLRAARAKSMKFKDGYMVSSGEAARVYIDAAVRHVLLRQGVLGIKVKIMKEFDPYGKRGPKTPMPDVVKVIEPKEDEYVSDKPYVGKEAENIKQLATHCKKTDNVDLKGPLASYVKATYTHSDAEDAADDLLSIQQLRNEIVLAHSNAGTPGLRDSLAKYYRSLTAIETRFPISKEKGHAAVAFTWYEAFRPAKKATQTNIHFEKAGVLFNYGAVIGQAALNCDRTSPEGLVQATKLFQEAAGVFVLLREGPASKTDTPRPADLTPECIMVMEKLMLAQSYGTSWGGASPFTSAAVAGPAWLFSELAGSSQGQAAVRQLLLLLLPLQAQECAYHKANLDKKSPTLVARLAKQTQVMYEEVARAFAAPSLAGIFDKLWISHTALKAAIYDVEMLAQVAKGMHAEDKVNVEVAVLREAFQRLQAAKKLARGETSDIVDSVQRVQEAITLALGKAEKDNNSIFLQRVPAFLDTGVSVQGACLVQPFKPAALDLATENLFSHLVPDTRFPPPACPCVRSAKALSRYTDMVDDVVRGLRDKLATATDNARIKLRELELPETLDALDPRSNSNYAASCLPDRLRAELEDIQSIGGLTHLNGILAEIGDLRKDVEQDLQAAAAALDSDAQEDLEMRTKFGEAWRIQASATATKPNWDRISQYRQSMTKAGDSDQGVMKRMADHDQGFKRLAIDAAALSMPRLQAPIVAMGPEDPAQVVAALRKDLDGLQVLAGERGGMEEALRDVKNKDNILPRLMTVPPQGHEALFASELKKYEALSADIERNCSAQADLLDRVERDNRLFRLAFDIQGWHNACEAAATDIKQEVKAFKELLDHCSEGLRFYLGMSEVVRRCRQESEDLAFTRRVQREETAQELAQITQRSVAAIVEVAGLVVVVAVVVVVVAVVALARSARQVDDEVLARRMAMAGLGGQQQDPPRPPYPSAPPPSQPPPPPPKEHHGMFGAIFGRGGAG
ncbi:hypothetical protein QJQ45_015416, partial [Haematococcus lacustris]